MSLRLFGRRAGRSARPQPAHGDNVVRMLMTTLAERDRRTEQHSCRVAPMSLRIAAEAGWAPGSREWFALEQAGRLHDIGKIGVSDLVLQKPMALSPEEWGEMRGHPEAAFRILQDTELVAWVSEIVRSHHERWDGSGYPRGLAGKNIDHGARIVALADAFDAMTAERPYRLPMSPEQARAEVVACVGTQFDPDLADAFLACFDDLAALTEGANDCGSRAA